MARYLVIHTPISQGEESPEPQPPTRMLDMAQDLGRAAASPRWITTWSPDLHDDRIFSMWESPNADAILRALDDYGFLNHMEAHALRVEEWGPEDVIAAQT